MQNFDFSGLIDKYETDFKVISEAKGGYDDSGEYVKGVITEQQMRGAIIAYSEEKVYRSEGTLTHQDRLLIMQESIAEALLGAEVIYRNKKYKIEDNTENAEFTGVYQYTLKYVSAFNKDGESSD